MEKSVSAKIGKAAALPGHPSGVPPLRGSPSPELCLSASAQASTRARKRAYPAPPPSPIKNRAGRRAGRPKQGLNVWPPARAVNQAAAQPTTQAIATAEASPRKAGNQLKQIEPPARSAAGRKPAGGIAYKPNGERLTPPLAAITAPPGGRGDPCTQSNSEQHPSGGSSPRGRRSGEEQPLTTSRELWAFRCVKGRGQAPYRPHPFGARRRGGSAPRAASGRHP